MIWILNLEVPTVAFKTGNGCMHKRRLIDQERICYRVDISQD